MTDKEKEAKEEIIYGILKNNSKVISINKLPFIIGRSEKSDLCINNPSISKNHAIIQIDAEEDMNLINKEQNIILADNSLNGTYVNGTKIENGKKILLETGDKISFGNDKNIFIFELMNYNHDKTIVYPNLNLLEFEKIENQPISLVNENNYKKPEINHLNIDLDAINIQNNNSNENKKINIEKNLINSQEENPENKKNNENMKTEENINREQISSLNQEIFDLKKKNELLNSELNNLRETLNKYSNTLNRNDEFRINNSEINYSFNNSNINLLADDIRELGLFRRIKECLIPNYNKLNFEELSNKFDEIIISYKKKYDIEEIILNMENEFNNEITKFNNIISLQQEQKRDSLNKINYIFNKENNLNENSNYVKMNKYLMDELNKLINDKETNIKIINQLKGNVIKLRTELNLYKLNYYNKNINKKVIRKENKEDNIKETKENIINTNTNNMNEEELMKNYIDYNIGKYTSGYQYNQNKKNNNKIDVPNGNDNFIKNKKEYMNDDNFRRLNILLENSQNNKRYNEIIKQREMILNSN